MIFGNDQKILFKIRQSENSKFTEVTEDSCEIVKSIEISNLRVYICDESGKSYFNDKALQKLIHILIESKQKTMRIVTVRGVNLDNAMLANEFLNLVSNEHLQARLCSIFNIIFTAHFLGTESLNLNLRFFNSRTYPENAITVPNSACPQW